MLMRHAHATASHASARVQTLASSSVNNMLMLNKFKPVQTLASSSVNNMLMLSKKLSPVQTLASWKVNNMLMLSKKLNPVQELRTTLMMQIQVSELSLCSSTSKETPLVSMSAQFHEDPPLGLGLNLCKELGKSGCLTFWQETNHNMSQKVEALNEMDIVQKNPDTNKRYVVNEKHFVSECQHHKEDGIFQALMFSLRHLICNFLTWHAVARLTCSRLNPHLQRPRSSLAMVSPLACSGQAPSTNATALICRGHNPHSLAATLQLWPGILRSGQCPQLLSGVSSKPLTCTTPRCPTVATANPRL